MPRGEMHPSAIIEIEIQNLGQLFNSMDPTPFPVKDLDSDAEEFLVSWAKEFPESTELKLVVHLRDGSTGAGRIVKDAIHHYFNYRSELSQREFRQLMRRGRTSLVVGLAFLASCLFLSELLNRVPGTIALVAREGLVIGGWVAMWRPLEILLYDWWPLRRSRRIFDRLAAMDIEVDAENSRQREHRPAPARNGCTGSPLDPRHWNEEDDDENQHRTPARIRESANRRARADPR